MSKVVNVKKANLIKLGYADFEDWKKDKNNVYIGRDMSCYIKGADGSKWANPFPVKKYTRDTCLKMYEEYIKDDDDLISDIDELRGKTLGCWCKPEKCHGDILIKLLNDDCA